ncbi:PLP-dependent aminotransferase family protein [Paenibacillus rhizovicinus]|uniref:PLP-dependent aminotransferase family protein n=1 Tax=Paenibacillus rhizovicinus TaxID=2704463 RepID=A0A6C0P4R1_9BACL|nr:PLP-dependent aminotransferase family protein [Paenibacillus rhizovicinus]
MFKAYTNVDSLKRFRFHHYLEVRWRGGDVIDLALSFDADEPLYSQLYHQIRTQIQEGVLPDGMKLPSIRSLGRQLSISKTTIETAYHMLLEEGFVTGKERARMMVVNPNSKLNSIPGQSPSPSLSLSPNPSTSPKSNPKPNLNPNQYPGRSSETAADAVVQHEPITHSGAATIDFSLLTIDGDSFPVRIWKSVVGESLALHSESLHEYGDSQGEYSLRENLAHYLRQSRGVRCTPEQIVIGTGISSSIHLLSKLLGENLAVGIEHPGIAQVGRYFAQNRFQLVPFSIASTGDFVQEIARKRIHALYATPSHRPTGEPLPYAVRQQMLQWAYDNNGYIIEDDYDGELRLSGKPIPSLQGLDKNGTVIYLGSFSKVFTPALRMNYMVLPPRLAEQLCTIDAAFSCPSRMNQWAMDLFIARGHWYRHLRRMRKRYRFKHEALVRLINRHLPPDAVQVNSSGSGLHVELSIEAPVSAERLMELARREGVLVYGSQDPQSRLACGNPKIYMGFGGVKDDEMERGVRLLMKAWTSVLS